MPDRRESLIVNLDNPHLNYIQFQMKIDDKYGIETVLPATRAIVEEKMEEKARISSVLGGLTVETSVADIIEE